MASSPKPASTAPRKTRNRKPAYYLASLNGAADPVIVVAHTHKDALAAVVTLKSATPQDLVDAGRNAYKFIDTTAPKQAESSKYVKVMEGDFNVIKGGAA